MASWQRCTPFRGLTPTDGISDTAKSSFGPSNTGRERSHLHLSWFHTGLVVSWMLPHPTWSVNGNMSNGQWAALCCNAVQFYDKQQPPVGKPIMLQLVEIFPSGGWVLRCYTAFVLCQQQISPSFSWTAAQPAACRHLLMADLPPQFPEDMKSSGCQRRGGCKFQSKNCHGHPCLCQLLRCLLKYIYIAVIHSYLHWRFAWPAKQWGTTYRRSRSQSFLPVRSHYM